MFSAFSLDELLWSPWKCRRYDDHVHCDIHRAQLQCYVLQRLHNRLSMMKIQSDRVNQSKLPEIMHEKVPVTHE
uniref:Uncharacterized protein n=1 Tax=Schistosoma mansoni TaxID=6183 RepID=A0A5K4F9T3_SCHMA